LWKKIFNLRRVIGNFGEWAAALYLRCHGHEIWARNWRCRAGEVDIIAFKESALLFVEVKTRVFFGTSVFSPFDAIGKRKTEHMHATAAQFLHEYRRDLQLRHLRRVRIDAVGISVFIAPSIFPLKIKLQHIEEAA